MDKKLTGTILANIGATNTNYISSGTSLECIICSKCNKQIISFWGGTPAYSNYCTCNQSATKSDLEILQDEVKSLKKKVDRLIKIKNK